jgi:nucleoid-associated protein YgaU
MYSTKFTLEPELKDFAVDNNANAKANAVFIGRLDTPTNVSRVIALNVHPGAVIVSPNSANTTLKCPLNVNAMYLGEDGRLMSTARQYEVEANTDNHEGMKCKATAVCGRDVYGVAAGNGIELRIPIEINVKESGQMKVNMLSNLSYDETAPTDYSKAPSLVVSHAPKDDSLWSLAKKYRSTRKLIMAANGLENEDSLTAGQLLIIPKK